MSAFASSIPGALGLSEVFFGHNSWIGAIFFVGLFALILLSGPKALFMAGRAIFRKSPFIGRILQNRLVGVILICLLGLVGLMIFTVTSVSVFLQPNQFIGWQEGKPLSYGRLVSSITRFPWGNLRYCPQANVEGIVRNDSGVVLKLEPITGNVHVEETNPSADYTYNVTFTGIPGGMQTTIQPGQSARMTLSAKMPSELCGDFNPETIEALRKGRLKVSGNFLVTYPEGRTSTVPFSFDELPIAQGGV